MRSFRGVRHPTEVNAKVRGCEKISSRSETPFVIRDFVIRDFVIRDS